MNKWTGEEKNGLKLILICCCYHDAGKAFHFNANT